MLKNISISVLYTHYDDDCTKDTYYAYVQLDGEAEPLLDGHISAVVARQLIEQLEAAGFKTKESDSPFNPQIHYREIRNF